MSKAHFDDAAGAARGDVVGGGEGLRGETVPAPEIKGTGVFLGDKELSHEELAGLKETAPDIHAAITGMRGELASRAKAEAGASKSSIVREGLPLPTPSTAEPAKQARPTMSPEMEAALKQVEADKGRFAPEVTFGRNKNRGGAKKAEGEARTPAAPEHLPGRRFGNHLEELHQQLSTMVDTLKSSDDGGLRILAAQADEPLAEADHHIYSGHTLLGARQNTAGRAAYIRGLGHIKRVMSVLNNDYVKSAGERLHINTELPSLEEAEKARATSRLKAGADPFSEVALGRKMEDINSETARGFAVTAGNKLEKGTKAAAKIATARRGAGRPAKARVDREGNVILTDMEAAQGRAAAAASLVKTKANATTRQDVEFRSDAQRNVPGIMGKPEIGADIGSQEKPELPKPTGPVMKMTETPEQRAARVARASDTRMPSAKNQRRRNAQIRQANVERGEA
jgi:hypothetical protein